MKQSEKINKDIEANKKLQAEVSETLLSLQAKYTAMQVEVGDKLLTNKNTSTKELDELKDELDRQSLTSQAYARRITILQEELAQALEDEKRIELEDLRDQAVKANKETVRLIYALYQTSVKLVGLEREYARKGGGYRGRGLYMGIPNSDVLNKTDAWLYQASQGNKDMQAILDEESVPSYSERQRARSARKGK